MRFLSAALSLAVVCLRRVFLPVSLPLKCAWFTGRCFILPRGEKVNRLRAAFFVFCFIPRISTSPGDAYELAARADAVY